MTTALEILLWLAAGMWVLLLLQMIVNTIAIRDIGRIALHTPEEWPLVSIVVPARDEAARVGEAVMSFCRQGYPAFEVIVVDDRSTDATPQILGALQTQFPNLTVVAGHDPPPGWLGKPNALETGRRQARGDWLLFVDADVVFAPDLLRRAVAHALHTEAAMVFLFPSLTTRGVFEAAILSALYLVPFAGIPLFLISRTRTGWLAAGGGAFNLVRRDALEAAGAFATLKSSVIDDVRLAVTVKSAGFKEVVARAGARLQVRMYDGARAAVAGFTKNAHMLIGARRWTACFPFVVGIVFSLLPYYGFAAACWAGSISVPASIALAGMHVVMASLAVIFRQPWYITFLNPLREVCWWWILIRSYRQHRRHGVVWRGRTYGRLARAEGHRDEGT